MKECQIKRKDLSLHVKPWISAGSFKGKKGILPLHPGRWQAEVATGAGTATVTRVLADRINEGACEHEKVVDAESLRKKVQYNEGKVKKEKVSFLEPQPTPQPAPGSGDTPPAEPQAKMPSSIPQKEWVDEGDSKEPVPGLLEPGKAAELVTNVNQLSG